MAPGDYSFTNTPGTQKTDQLSADRCSNPGKGRSRSEGLRVKKDNSVKSRVYCYRCERQRIERVWSCLQFWGGQEVLQRPVRNRQENQLDMGRRRKPDDSSEKIRSGLNGQKGGQTRQTKFVAYDVRREELELCSSAKRGGSAS